LYLPKGLLSPHGGRARPVRLALDRMPLARLALDKMPLARLAPDRVPLGAQVLARAPRHISSVGARSGQGLLVVKRVALAQAVVHITASVRHLMA